MNRPGEGPWGSQQTTDISDNQEEATAKDVSDELSDTPKITNDDADIATEARSGAHGVALADSNLELSKEQEAALEAALEGTNLFITGSAGVGKSLLVLSIVRELELKRKVVAVTASTGIAAVNVGGCTVHSFAGIGLGEGTKEELADLAFKNPTVRDRWRKTDVLLMDEVSMVDDELLRKIDHVARRCRGWQPSEGGGACLETGAHGRRAGHNGWGLLPAASGG
jgi:ATP-dependent DNA helicase PIF1